MKNHIFIKYIYISSEITNGTTKLPGESLDCGYAMPSYRSLSVNSVESYRINGTRQAATVTRKCWIFAQKVFLLTKSVNRIVTWRAWLITQVGHRSSPTYVNYADVFLFDHSSFSDVLLFCHDSHCTKSLIKWMHSKTAYIMPLRDCKTEVSGQAASVLCETEGFVRRRNKVTSDADL